MTNNIETRIAQIIQQVTQEQIAHLLGAGEGRYKQYQMSDSETIDGYAFSWDVDEFLGPSGVGCVFHFYCRQDGRVWQMIDGHGPGYVEGPDSGWVEQAEA